MNILVADDEENIRELITEHLRGENYNVYCAANGKEALDIIRTFKKSKGK